MQQNKKDKSILPPPFAYKYFLLGGRRYIEFPSKVAFPLDMLEIVLFNCKKKKLMKGEEVVSCFLPIPKNALKSQSTKFVAKQKDAKKN